MSSCFVPSNGTVVLNFAVDAAGIVTSSVWSAIPLLTLASLWRRHGTIAAFPSLPPVLRIVTKNLVVASAATGTQNDWAATTLRAAGGVSAVVGPLLVAGEDVDPPPQPATAAMAMTTADAPTNFTVLGSRNCSHGAALHTAGKRAVPGRIIGRGETVWRPSASSASAPLEERRGDDPEQPAHDRRDEQDPNESLAGGAKHPVHLHPFRVRSDQGDRYGQEHHDDACPRVEPGPPALAPQALAARLDRDEERLHALRWRPATTVFVAASTS